MAIASLPWPGRRSVRRHCSSTERVSVLCAARAAATAPPAKATSAATTGAQVSSTGTPATRTDAAKMWAATTASTSPIGTASPSSASGSPSPNRDVAHGENPRSLAIAISLPRASIASETTWNSTSQASSPSCSVIISMATLTCCRSFAAASRICRTFVCAPKPSCDLCVAIRCCIAAVSFGTSLSRIWLGLTG